MVNFSFFHSKFNFQKLEGGFEKLRICFGEQFSDILKVINEDDEILDHRFMADLTNEYILVNNKYIQQ